MSIDKLKNKFSTGAFVADVKHYFSKINEIIDYLNGNPIPAPTPALDYKIYRATLTQTGVNAPVATILENTLGTINYAYDGAGMYIVQSAGLFTSNKTFFRVSTDTDNNYAAEGQAYITMFYSDSTEIYLSTWHLKETAGVTAKTFANGIVGYSTQSTLIEIIVYN